MIIPGRDGPLAAGGAQAQDRLPAPMVPAESGVPRPVATVIGDHELQRVYPRPVELGGEH